MELETAFYIVGIIFMTLMTGVLIALLIAVLVIKAKINKLHDMVGERVDQVKAVGSKLAMGFAMVRNFVKR